MIERDFLISKKTDKGLNRGERYKLALVSLGCDKNRVDSEIMLGMLKNKYQMTEDPMEADIIIVNTCGFIEAAKEESINTILEMARFKEEGQCKLLIATGCLTQRYGEELMREMPELDVILGVNSYAKLDEYVEKFIVDRKRIIDTAWSDVGVNDGRRLLTTNFGMTAYVRIGEGCDNNCTYCIIPKIRGKYRSRDRDSIMTEIRLLADSGVREIIVIAQDITEYGRDTEGRQVLHELLEEMNGVEGLKWIRLLYMYPEGIYDDLLATIAKSEKILPYFDMPIQQISDSVLHRMGRRTNRQAIEEVIAKIRSLMPESIIRTSLITGFPGETEEEFEELKTWLTEIKLDKVGVFAYSKEEGTPAWHMKDQVSEEIKLERRGELMLAQQAVSLAKNEAKLGSVYDVLVEGKIEDYYTGRSYEMAPEIDGEILIETNKELIAGNWIKVKITEALEYDLIGEVYHESSK
ncbi:MAG: 30S ribosomal protein S12 methylthiotransferase RimO [Clostridium sp.]|nr:30S ribosomal protein S12 methylthiotransferase RimO [Clostridium sp.]